MTNYKKGGCTPQRLNIPRYTVGGVYPGEIPGYPIPGITMPSRAVSQQRFDQYYGPVRDRLINMYGPNVFTKRPSGMPVGTHNVLKKYMTFSSGDKIPKGAKMEEMSSILLNAPEEDLRTAFSDYDLSNLSTWDKLNLPGELGMSLSQGKAFADWVKARKKEGYTFQEGGAFTNHYMYHPKDKSISVEVTSLDEHNYYKRLGYVHDEQIPKANLGMETPPVIADAEAQLQQQAKDIRSKKYFDGPSAPQNVNTDQYINDLTGMFTGYLQDNVDQVQNKRALDMVRNAAYAASGRPPMFNMGGNFFDEYDPYATFGMDLHNPNMGAWANAHRDVLDASRNFVTSAKGFMGNLADSLAEGRQQTKSKERRWATKDPTGKSDQAIADPASYRVWGKGRMLDEEGDFKYGIKTLFDKEANQQRKAEKKQARQIQKDWKDLEKREKKAYKGQINQGSIWDKDGPNIFDREAIQERRTARSAFKDIKEQQKELGIDWDNWRETSPYDNSKDDKPTTISDLTGGSSSSYGSANNLMGNPYTIQRDMFGNPISYQSPFTWWNKEFGGQNLIMNNMKRRDQFGGMINPFRRRYHYGGGQEHPHPHSSAPGNIYPMVGYSPSISETVFQDWVNQGKMDWSQGVNPNDYPSQINPFTGEWYPTITPEAYKKLIQEGKMKGDEYRYGGRKYHKGGNLPTHGHSSSAQDMDDMINPVSGNRISLREYEAHQPSTWPKNLPGGNPLWGWDEHIPGKGKQSYSLTYPDVPPISQDVHFINYSGAYPGPNFETVGGTSWDDEGLPMIEGLTGYWKVTPSVAAQMNIPLEDAWEWANNTSGPAQLPYDARVEDYHRNRRNWEPGMSDVEATNAEQLEEAENTGKTNTGGGGGGGGRGGKKAEDNTDDPAKNYEDQKNEGNVIDGNVSDEDIDGGGDGRGRRYGLPGYVEGDLGAYRGLTWGDNTMLQDARFDTKYGMFGRGPRRKSTRLRFHSPMPGSPNQNPVVTPEEIPAAQDYSAEYQDWFNRMYSDAVPEGMVRQAPVSYEDWMKDYHPEAAANASTTTTTKQVAPGMTKEVTEPTIKYGPDYWYGDRGEDGYEYIADQFTEVYGPKSQIELNKLYEAEDKQRIKEEKEKQKERNKITKGENQAKKRINKQLLKQKELAERTIQDEKDMLDEIRARKERQVRRQNFMYGGPKYAHGGPHMRNPMMQNPMGPMTEQEAMLADAWVPGGQSVAGWHPPMVDDTRSFVVPDDMRHLLTPPPIPGGNPDPYSDRDLFERNNPGFTLGQGPGSFKHGPRVIPRASIVPSPNSFVDYGDSISRAQQRHLELLRNNPPAPMTAPPIPTPIQNRMYGGPTYMDGGMHMNIHEPRIANYKNNRKFELAKIANRLYRTGGQLPEEAVVLSEQEIANLLAAGGAVKYI